MIADYFETLFPRLVSHAAHKGCRDPEGFASEAVTKSLAAEAQGKLIAPSYVYQALRNLMVDDRRRLGNVALVPIDDVLADLLPGPPGADIVESLATAAEAERLLAGLPPEQAEVLRLRAEGYHLAEVAAIVGRSEDAVKKLQTRGLAGALLDAQGVARQKPWLRPPPPAGPTWSCGCPKTDQNYIVARRRGITYAGCRDCWQAGGRRAA